MAAGRGTPPGAGGRVSLAGRIATRGSSVTVYRPQYGENTDRSRTITGYTVVSATGLKMLLEPITDELVQKVFGGSELVTERGYLMPVTADVKKDDRIKVEAGRRAGSRFVVDGARPNDSGSPRTAHLDLALVSTTEVF